MAALSPSTGIMGTRVQAEADAWAHFRMRKLKIRLNPAPVGNTSGQAAGYVGGIQDTVPSTVAQISELLPAVFMQLGQTVPSEWTSVKQEDLSGPIPWYKALVGAADNLEEAPGTIVVAGASTNAFILELRGVIEFKVAVAPANTPMAVAARLAGQEERLRILREAERTRIMRAISSPLKSV